MDVLVLDVHRRADVIIVATLVFYLNGKRIDQQPVEFDANDTEQTAMAKVQQKAQLLYDSIKRETALDFSKHIGKTFTLTVE